MTPTAKSALVLAAVGIVALVLAATDALSPVAGPPTTTIPTTIAPPASAPAPTTTTIDVQELVPTYLRDLDEDVRVAPLADANLPVCSEAALSGSVASIIVTSSDPDQRRIIIRVTNDSSATCALGVHLEVAFVTPSETGDTRLAVNRVNPPPGPGSPYSYRDPALKPGTSARFSVVAAGVDFVGAGADVTSAEISGRSGVLTRIALPGIRVVAATDWYGPASASATPLDPSSFLVPLPPDEVPTCDPATTRAEVQPDTDPTAGEVPLVVTNGSADACALPADLMMRLGAIDAAAEVARREPTSGTYVAPVVPAGGGIQFVVDWSGEASGEFTLSFPDEQNVVVTQDLASGSPVAWYGPVATTAGGAEE